MVVAVYEQWRRGEITKEQATDLIKVLVLTANTQGAAFGALSFQAYMETATGAALPITEGLKVLTPGEVTKARAAVDKAMHQPPHKQFLALQRLGFNAPVRAATDSFYRGMGNDSRVDSYTRGLEATACELCFWLWKEGYPYPVSQPMHRHPGCVCSQVPNIKEK